MGADSKSALSRTVPLGRLDTDVTFPTVTPCMIRGRTGGHPPCPTYGRSITTDMRSEARPRNGFVTTSAHTNAQHESTAPPPMTINLRLSHPPTFGIAPQLHLTFEHELWAQTPPQHDGGREIEDHDRDQACPDRPAGGSPPTPTGPPEAKNP